MAKLLRTFVHESPSCGYLHDRSSALDFQIMLNVSALELEGMLVRGWRRFGPSYFRPRCGHCSECVGIRVLAQEWSPSRSQRRVLQLNRDVRVRVGVPVTDPTRLALYKKWHAFREAERGWEPSVLDAEGYEIEFAYPHPAGRELSYWLQTPQGERLVAVGLCDQTPHAWSAIYCYYDPDFAKRSLGVLNVLTQLMIAQREKIAHVYLGFRVAPCVSMAYKSKFVPHELLDGRPSAHESPVWKRVQ
jgi:arginine-tRNA-protein transferase